MLLVDDSRCFRHQAGCFLGFRESDDVANRSGTGQNHHDPVEAEGDAAVRWCTELESIKQEAELLTGFFFADAEQVKHLALHGLVVNTNAASADF